MGVNREEFAKFVEFAKSRIMEVGDQVTLEDLVAEWSAQREIEETIADIEQGRKDYAAGKGETLDSVANALRDRLGIHQ